MNGDGIEEMLAVVEHEQQALARHCLHREVERSARIARYETECAGHGGYDQGRVG